MLEQARRLLPDEVGLLGCGRWLIPAGEADGVRLLHLPKTMGSRIVGVQRCGSVWLCPVCSAKITQHRQKELRRGVDTCVAGGGALVMLTYTFSHSSADTLPGLLGSSAKPAVAAQEAVPASVCPETGEVLAPAQEAVQGQEAVPASGLLGARSVSMSGRAYNDLKRECGLVGSVRCLEVTFGDNGPHPHFHDLAFLESDAAFLALVEADKRRYLVDLQAELTRQREANLAGGRKARARRILPALKYRGLQERHDLLVAGLEVLWHEGLAAVGLSASQERGFTASPFGQAGREVANYIEKFGHEPLRAPWDVSAELAKQPAKLGHVKGRTPMQLLADAAFCTGADAELAGERFRAYARAMKGRRHLVWSNGLRERLGLGQELTDEEAADAVEDEGAVDMDVLPANTWRLIAADRQQPYLRNVLDTGDAGKLAAFLLPYKQEAARSSVPCTVSLSRAAALAGVSTVAGAGPGAPALRGSAHEVTEWDADIAEFLFLCPSASEQQAAEWVAEAAARLGAARAVLKSEPGAVVASGLGAAVSPAPGEV